MWVMGRKEPLPTTTLVMCAVAPVSMYHAGEGDWVSDMVLKDCISWP